MPPFAAVVLAAAVCSAPAPAQQVIKRQGVKEAAADIAKAVREVAAAGKLAAVRVGKFTPINIDPDTAGLTLAADAADKELAAVVATAGEPRLTHFLVPAAKDGKSGEFVIPGRPTMKADGKPSWEPFRAAELKGAAVGMIHLAFVSPWEMIPAADAPQVIGLNPSGMVVRRAGDVPTEFVTILYQK